MISVKRIVFVSLFLSQLAYSKHAVTYELNGGRFGDNLISYISAAYFAYINKISLMYKEFEYSDLLVLSDLEPRSRTKSKKFTQKVMYNKNLNINTYDSSNPILFVTTFYNRPQPDASDKEFKKKMRKVIRPKIEIDYPPLPQDHIAIALHIRTGGGFKMDRQLYAKYPMRFAPFHFYRDQVKRLLLLYPKKKLYVHIFTDDKDPKDIVKYLKNEISSDRITYGCREIGNKHNQHVVEDFFFMLKFKCLIRPTSNFSKVAEFLGNYEIIIVPATYHKIDDETWLIDTIRFTQRQSDGKIKSIKIRCA